VAIATLAMIGPGSAADVKYPDWRGQWNRRVVPGLGGQPSFDQTRPWGRGQQAPLTPEYTAILEASLAEQTRGGQGNFTGHARCLPAGMPLMMVAFVPQEYVITPDTTYILINNADANRRIFTDGRDWPTGDIEATYQGYSIGRWIDEDGDGRFDLLEVETRDFKGPRAYDTSGLPLHGDNQTIVRERMRFPKDDPNTIRNEITTFDHALTHPWTVTKVYRRAETAQPEWLEMNCAENNPHIRIGTENYFIGADGMLMPAKKNQAPPDLRYFKQTAH
jgi:hypothetical protein